MMKKTDPPFDCMAYKRIAQAAIFEQIQHLSTDDQIQWFREAAATGPFADWVRRVQQARAPAAEADSHVAEGQA